MKKFITLSILFTSLVFVAPMQVSAATNAGLKPGNFFYIFDTVSENISLFFTFNPENKAKKALEYADERLAEIEAISGENNPDAVKTAISNYESNVALATEKSKEVEDKGQEKNLLNLISDNASKNQEVLSAVLIKVPEEAREAIAQAIEASKRGQEEARRQITELKQEVAGLKEEIDELKEQQKTEVIPVQNIDVQSQSTDIKELKKEIEELKKQAIEKKEGERQTIIPIIPIASPSISEPVTTSLIATPTMTPAIQTTSAISIAAPTQILTTPEISSINAITSLSSARIEWQTNIPTNSKIFVGSSGLPSKIYNSESGPSTRHIVNISGLVSGTTYSYEIESITGDQVVKKNGSFSTNPDEYIVSIQPDKTSVQATGWNMVVLKVSTLKNGQIQSNQSVSMTTPDSSQNNTRITSNLTSTGSGDWHNTFTYYPKTIGTHKLVFSWNGISKSVDIQATEYIKIDPTITNIVKNSVIETNSWAPKTIGTFQLSEADEPFSIREIKYESDIQESESCNFKLGYGSSYFCGLSAMCSNTPLNYTGINYQEQPYRIMMYANKDCAGTHTLTIEEIKIAGQSGYRTISGMPIIFTFEVK